MCPSRAELVEQRRCEVQPAALEARLRALGYADAQLVSLERLGKEAADLKGLGYGEPVRVRFRAAGREQSVVLRTVASSWYGHDRRSDRFAEVVLCFDTFGSAPSHVRALDVGALSPGGGLVSLRDAGEPYLITEYEQGRLYAQDLVEVGRRGSATPLDLARVDALVAWATALHAEKPAGPTELYTRIVRDLVGHGEGCFGIVDGYPASTRVAEPARLEALEHRMVRWRWRLRAFSHRLRATHGDFHPFNVLFREGAEPMLLDRSRGGCGDPADDVAAMTINYLFFGLRFPSGWARGYRALWTRFWERYLETTGDDELLAVIAPFYAWRALVVASPAWYPGLDDAVRDRLLSFAEQALDGPPFDPSAVGERAP